MILLLFWLGCAAIASHVAGNKGRSAFGWLLLGLLLGPIALLAAAIASPDRASEERRMVQARRLRHCPGCMELIRSEARLCRFCHIAVPPPRWDFWGREQIIAYRDARPDPDPPLDRAA